MTTAASTSSPKNDKSATKPPDTKAAAKPQAPKGYTDQSADVVGFYDEEIQSTIHFKPIEAVLSDSTIDASRTSILIFGELVEPCELIENAKTGNVVHGKPGDMIGVWAKPGMRGLRNLCNTPVYMYPEGEKEVGKPNPMKIYKTMATKKTTLVPIVEDRRDKSKHNATWLDPKGTGQEVAGF
jgi:hypothetical protein